MKIAIVTSPLMSNYGGLLQNWALQQIIKELSPEHEVITFDQVDWLSPILYRIGHSIKSKLRLTEIQTDSVFDIFRKNNISATSKISSIREIKKLEKRYKPDVIIVGSDQVWRPSMVRDLRINFLSFSKCPNKIAYAASLGTDKWEFSPSQTKKVTNWIRSFKAISVREATGISLLKENLNVSSTVVLDPTLLLDVEGYNRLISKPQLNQESVFTYILDSSPEKRFLAQNIIGKNREFNALYNIEGIKRSDFLSVEEWLRGIRDSKAVLCDSFHGVVFSIIFNKDFYVLENTERGNTRIKSLLHLFNLTERLITDVNNIPLVNPIDWNDVNAKLTELKRKSFKFLETYL